MKINAFAKINLSLDITGKLPNGYHAVETVMQSVSLCDTLTVDRAGEITVLCGESIPSGKDNLAFKAAEKFFEYCNICGGARIVIEKHIPVAAGLGGGSTDAAAVINALNIIYGAGLRESELQSIAASVGTDVPFCITGGTALGTGTGSDTEKLADLPDCRIVIAKKGEKKSTADMYRKIDSVTGLTGSDISVFLSGRPYTLKDAFGHICNSFEFVSDGDTVLKAKELLKKNGAIHSMLSGAGPSVFGIFPISNGTDDAVRELNASGYEAYVCSPVLFGYKIIE